MREVELRARLNQHLSHPYSLLWAQTQVIGSLGQRTVDEALAAGVPCKQIWRCAWAALELPDSDR
jgi:hypothetical protein